MYDLLGNTGNNMYVGSIGQKRFEEMLTAPTLGGNPKSPVSNPMERAVALLLLQLVLPPVPFVGGTYAGNYALRFDGKDDTVLISHLPMDADLPDGPWTLEAWVKPDIDAHYNQVFFFRRGCHQRCFGH